MKLLYGLLLAAAALAQLPPAAVLQNGKIDDEKVWLVDAVARDASGNEVADLKSSDFQVLQDGVAVTVVGAVHVDAQTPRSFILIVDDYNLSNAILTRVRDAVLEFVDRKTRPADRISILRTRSGVGTLQQLTEDRAVLHAAAAAIHAGVPQGVSQAERYSVATAGTLRLAMSGAIPMQGRKIVVLFSNRFRSADLEEAATLTKWADAAGAVVYQVAMGVADGDAKPLVESEPEVLARSTGGRTIEGSENPAAALDTMLRDVTGYYNIRFSGGTQAYDYPAGGVRTEKLTVRTERPGVTLHSRTNDIIASTENGPVAPEDSLTQAVRSPFASGDVNLRLAPYIVRDQQNRPHVEAGAWVDPAGLASVTRLDGAQKATTEVGLVTFGRGGTSAKATGRTLAITIASERGTPERGILTSLAFEDHLPGLYLLRVALLDELTGRAGQATAIIDVPGFAQGKLAVGLLPLQRSREEAAKWKNDVAGAGIFEAGGGIVYSCQFYNAAVTSDNRSRLESAVKVYREGRIIFNGAPEVVEFEQVVTPQQRVLGGILSFGSQPAPGEYTIEITVTDTLAPGAPKAVAVQTMELRR